MSTQCRVNQCCTAMLANGRQARTGCALAPCLPSLHSRSCPQLGSLPACSCACPPACVSGCMAEVQQRILRCRTSRPAFAWCWPSSWHRQAPCHSRCCHRRAAQLPAAAHGADCLSCALCPCSLAQLMPWVRGRSGFLLVLGSGEPWGGLCCSASLSCSVCTRCDCAAVAWGWQELFSHAHCRHGPAALYFYAFD